MVHPGRARRTRDAWGTPQIMSAARTSIIPLGSTKIPSAGPPWLPPGVQGHLRLARLGDPVDDLLDVHAAARGLIEDPALRYTVAQGSECGRVPKPRAAPRHWGRVGGVA